MFPNKIEKLINQDELEAKLGTICYRVTSDVLDLPAAHHVTRTCTLSAGARRVYVELERQMVSTLEDYDAGRVTVHNVLTKLLRLQQITGGTLRDDDGTERTVDTAKAEALAEVLDEIGPREPVVVFCRFRADLDRVAALAGDGYRELSGRCNDLGAWQRGDGTVLGVQLHAGGVGVDLTRARYAVYYSVSYALGDYEQSLARVHRPGQTRPVTYVHLLAANTIDETIQRALRDRRNVVESLLERLKARQQMAVSA